jgi:hypothetical protein
MSPTGPRLAAPDGMASLAVLFYLRRTNTRSAVVQRPNGWELVTRTRDAEVRRHAIAQTSAYALVGSSLLSRLHLQTPADPAGTHPPAGAARDREPSNGSVVDHDSRPRLTSSHGA